MKPLHCNDDPSLQPSQNLNPQTDDAQSTIFGEYYYTHVI